MQITDISPQKKNPHRVNIYLDGEFAFSLTAELAFQHSLKVEKVLSPSETKDLVIKDQKSRLLEKAYRFLSFRPRSEKEVVDYFFQKKIILRESEQEQRTYRQSVEEVIDYLKSKGQLNDLEFAKWWVEQRNRFRPKGVKLLKMELGQKGVTAELIDKVLETKDEKNQALRVALKKLSSFQKMPYLEFKQKMGGFLYRRGFGWDTIKSVIDTLKKKKYN